MRWCAALIVASVPLWIYWLHGRAQREVEKYKRQLRAAGERLTIAELRGQAILPERNGAVAFRQAEIYLNSQKSVLETNPPLSMHLVAPGVARVAWQQPEIADPFNIRDGATNTWEQLEAALEKQRPVLDLIEEAAGKPVLDFQLDYTQGAFLPLPHLGPLQGAVLDLSAAAMWDLRHGDSESATKKLLAMLGLVKGLEHEPLVISQLVRMAMAQISVATEWELLQAPNLQDDQLASLQSAWREEDFFGGAEESLAMERAINEHMLAQMRESSAQFRRYASGSGRPATMWNSFGGDAFQKWASITVEKARQIQWRTAWSYPDQLRTLRGEQALLDAIRLARREDCFTNAFRQQQNTMVQLGIPAAKETGLLFDSDQLQNLFSASVRELQGFIHRVGRAEAARSLAVTALALKRYQLRSGRYPSDLSQLVPDFLPAMPRDPIDGQPLRYRLNPDGTFLLYSIGDDGVDDGGNAANSDTKSKTPSWQSGRDLVWPQPAVR